MAKHRSHRVAEQDVCYHFGDAVLDLVARELRNEGAKVKLQPRHFDLLCHMVVHAGRVLSREQLLDAVWGQGVEHNLSTVDKAISRIRRSMEESAPALLDRVLTLPGRGYRFDGPVVQERVKAAAQRIRTGMKVPGRPGFQLLHTLGSGSRGDVWLGQHIRTGEQSVFKFAETASRRKALQREERVLSTLAGRLPPVGRAGIVQIKHSNFATPPHYLECSYGGSSLLSWSREGNLIALDREQRLALFGRILAAVRWVHEAQVRHHDLKPANILVERDGTTWTVRLIDFGSGSVARTVGSELSRELGPQMTSRSDLADDPRRFTLAYLAPELLDPKTKASDATDLYALGVILLQLLLGDLDRVPPFDWQQGLDDDILVELICAATNADPARRIARVCDLQDRLAQVDQLRAQRARELEAARDAEFERTRAINEFLIEDLIGTVGIGQIGPGGKVSMHALLLQASACAKERFSSRPVIEAAIHTQLGRSLFELGQTADSMAEYETALGLVPTGAQDREALLVRSQTRIHAARVLGDQNRIQEARDMLGKAMTEMSVARIEPGATERFAIAQTQLMLTVMTECYAEAIGIARQALFDAEQLPSIRLDHRFLAAMALAEVYYLANDFQSAESLLEDLLTSERYRGTSPALHAKARIALARTQRALGRDAPIERTLCEARDELLALVGISDRFVPVADAELGEIYRQEGEFARAVEAYGRAQEAFRTQGLGQENSKVRIMSLNMAIAASNAGGHERAIEVLEAERPWFASSMGGERGPIVQAIDFSLACAWSRSGQPERALETFAHLDAQMLANAEPAQGWSARLRVETGLAMMRAAGTSGTGAELVLHGIDELAQVMSPRWLVERYRAELHRCSNPTGPPKSAY